MGILDTIKNKITDTGKKEIKDKPARGGSASGGKEDVKREDKKTTSKAVVKKDKKVAKKKIGGDAYRILMRPLITEKVTELGVYNKYAFEISLNANKTEVKKAVKEVYGVTPISVNIINMKGKRVRSGRTMGKKKDWKKAVITLKAGEKIEVYQGV